MKHLKAKLMMSVISLMLATIMMTTASFAWFTISTNPEISDIKTTIGSNANLEIALSSAADFATATADSGTSDAGKNITWGNLVDLGAYFNNANFQLKPVAVDLTTKKVSIPSFGLDGRISALTETTGTWTSLVASPNDATDFDDGGLLLYKDTAETPWAFRVDFFMRTNVAGDIKLQATGVDRGDGSTTAGLGAGTTITEGSKATVAFQVNGGDIVKFYDGTQTSPAWDTTNKIFTAEANTIYKVSMYVYYDGATLTNATMETEIKDMALNVQFLNTNIPGTTGNNLPLDVVGTGHDKPTTT